MSTKTKRLLLQCALTDSTFELSSNNKQELLTGKCIHCNRKHSITLEGDAVTNATIEHIIPLNHGGTDDVVNLAIACSGCNGHKGLTLDRRKWTHPGLQQMVKFLQERRMQRFRDIPEEFRYLVHWYRDNDWDRLSALEKMHQNG